MAITNITPIDFTPEKTIDYCMADKTMIWIDESGKECMKCDRRGVPEKYHTLNTFVNCRDLSKPKNYFDELKNLYLKNKKSVKDRTKSGAERELYHCWQNFGVQLDPVISNEIGRKFAEEMFAGFACIVSTHTNTNYTHNHILVCAYNIDGRHKYHDCIANTNRMREISDRLCIEYGLPVLEETKKMKLITYKDKNGKVHYWEPTDRKIKIARQREEGIEKNDVNSYRNTSQYQKAAAFKTSGREKIKEDIDILLNSVISYDDLIFRLQEIGYEVKSKRKDGSWLEHVTFKGPNQSNPARDNSIGDKISYTRNALTDTIKNRVAGRRESIIKKVSLEIGDKIPTPQEKYIYGKFDMDRLHPDFRKEYDSDGRERIVGRGELEHSIVLDILKKHKEIDLRFNNYIKHDIGKERTISPKYRASIVKQIQQNFDALNTIERGRIKTIHQIIGAVEVMEKRYDALMNEYNRVEKVITQLEYRLSLPEKIKELSSVIGVKRTDTEYMAENYHLDKSLLDSYISTVQKSGLDEPENYSTALQFTIKKRNEIQKQSTIICKFKKRLDEYKVCMETIGKILSDIKGKNILKEVMEEYKKTTGVTQSNGSKKRKDRSF